MSVSWQAWQQLQAPLHLSSDAMIRSALPLCAKERLGIFIACPKQLNANCKASGSAFFKKGRGVTHLRVAQHLELASNCTQISQLPAVSQLIGRVLIHTFEIPRVEPLELVCWCSKDTRAAGGD